MKTFIIAKMLDRCNFNTDDKVLIIGCLTDIYDSHII